MNRHILITGPTTTGKTKLATLVARKLNAHLINSDKFHLFRDFEIGIGIEPGDYDIDLARHLYGILDPKDDVLSLEQYLQLHQRAREQASYCHAVVEGGSFSYNQALLGSRPFLEVYCMTWESDDWIIDKMRSRIAGIFEGGIVEETRILMSRSLEDSYVMTKGLIYRGIISYLEGRCTFEAAKEEILRSSFRAAKYQKNRYDSLSGVKFLSVEMPIQQNMSAILNSEMS